MTGGEGDPEGGGREPRNKAGNQTVRESIAERKKKSGKQKQSPYREPRRAGKAKETDSKPRRWPVLHHVPLGHAAPLSLYSPEKLTPSWTNHIQSTPRAISSQQIR